MTQPVSNSSSTTASYSASAAAEASPTTPLSSDVLLGYCQMQLGSLDGEVNTQLTAQTTALADRSAVDDVSTAFETFGTDGPKSVGQLLVCTQAIDKAMSGLAPSDPLYQTLKTQEKTLTGHQNNSGPSDPTVGLSPDAGTINDQTSLDSPIDAGTWKSITDTVTNASADIKSSAEIQMLKLQDLISQRQQAVEEVTGIMSKEDQSLEDGAKAIGR